MSKAVVTAILLFLPLAALICHAADEKVLARQTPVSSASKSPQNYPKIVLYSASWCPHCRQAKEYFKEHHIPYENRDVDEDQQAREDLFAIAGRQKPPIERVGVPLIVIGNEERVINGFLPAQFEAAVNEIRRHSAK